MDLQGFTTIDEVGDDDEIIDNEVRNNDKIVNNLFPNTAAEEIDYLNQILADIENTTDVKRKIEDSKVDNFAKIKTVALIEADINNSILSSKHQTESSFNNKNSDDRNVSALPLLNELTSSKVSNLDYFVESNSRSSQLPSNFDESQHSLDFSALLSGNLTNELNNKSKETVSNNKCVLDIQNLNHTLDKNLMTELDKSDPNGKNACENIENLTSDKEPFDKVNDILDPCCKKDLEETKTEQPNLNECDESFVLNNGIVGIKCHSDNKGEKNISQNPEFSNLNIGVEKSNKCENESIADFRSSSVSEKLGVNTSKSSCGNGVPTQDKVGEGTASEESDNRYINISLPLKISLIKTEPIDPDMEDPPDFEDYMHDPASEINLDSFSNVKEELPVVKQEFCTNIYGPFLEDSGGTKAKQLQKGASLDSTNLCAYSNECHYIPNVHFRIAHKRVYSKEQVNAAYIMAQSSSSKVIDMEMFENLSKSFPIVNSLKLETVVKNCSKSYFSLPMCDTRLLDVFISKYGNNIRKWSKYFNFKFTCRKSKGKDKIKIPKCKNNDLGSPSCLSFHEKKAGISANKEIKQKQKWYNSLIKKTLKMGTIQNFEFSEGDFHGFDGNNERSSLDHEKNNFNKPSNNSKGKSEASGSSKKKNEASEGSKKKNEASEGSKKKNEASEGSKKKNEASESSKKKNEASESSKKKNEFSESSKRKSEASASSKMKRRKSSNILKVTEENSPNVNIPLVDKHGKSGTNISPNSSLRNLHPPFKENKNSKLLKDDSDLKITSNKLTSNKSKLQNDITLLKHCSVSLTPLCIKQNKNTKLHKQRRKKSKKHDCKNSNKERELMALNSLNKNKFCDKKYDLKNKSNYIIVDSTSRSASPETTKVHSSNVTEELDVQKCVLPLLTSVNSSKVKDNLAGIESKTVEQILSERAVKGENYSEGCKSLGPTAVTTEDCEEIKDVTLNNLGTTESQKICSDIMLDIIDSVHNIVLMSNSKLHKNLCVKESTFCDKIDVTLKNNSVDLVSGKTLCGINSENETLSNLANTVQNTCGDSSKMTSKSEICKTVLASSDKNNKSVNDTIKIHCPLTKPAQNIPVENNKVDMKLRLKDEQSLTSNASVKKEDKVKALPVVLSTDACKQSSSNLITVAHSRSKSRVLVATTQSTKNDLVFSVDPKYKCSVIVEDIAYHKKYRKLIKRQKRKLAKINRKVLDYTGDKEQFSKLFSKGKFEQNSLKLGARERIEGISALHDKESLERNSLKSHTKTEIEDLSGSHVMKKYEKSPAKEILKDDTLNTHSKDTFGKELSQSNAMEGLDKGTKLNSVEKLENSLKLHAKKKLDNATSKVHHSKEKGEESLKEHTKEKLGKDHLKASKLSSVTNLLAKTENKTVKTYNDDDGKTAFSNSLKDNTKMQARSSQFQSEAHSKKKEIETKTKSCGFIEADTYVKHKELQRENYLNLKASSPSEIKNAVVPTDLPFFGSSFKIPKKHPNDNKYSKEKVVPKSLISRRFEDQQTTYKFLNQNLGNNNTISRNSFARHQHSLNSGYVPENKKNSLCRLESANPEYLSKINKKPSLAFSKSNMQLNMKEQIHDSNRFHDKIIPTDHIPCGMEDTNTFGSKHFGDKNMLADERSSINEALHNSKEKTHFPNKISIEKYKEANKCSTPVIKENYSENVETTCKSLNATYSPNASCSSPMCSYNSPHSDESEGEEAAQCDSLSVTDESKVTTVDSGSCASIYQHKIPHTVNAKDNLSSIFNEKTHTPSSEDMCLLRKELDNLSNPIKHEERSNKVHDSGISSFLSMMQALDKKKQFKLYAKYKSLYNIAKKRFHDEPGDINKSASKLKKFNDLNVKRKLYYDLKLYLYEQKKQRDMERKNQTTEIQKEIPNRCASNDEPYSPSSSPLLLNEADTSKKSLLIKTDTLDQTMRVHSSPFYKRELNNTRKLKETSIDVGNSLTNKEINLPQSLLSLFPKEEHGNKMDGLHSVTEAENSLLNKPHENVGIEDEPYSPSASPVYLCDTEFFTSLKKSTNFKDLKHDSSSLSVNSPADEKNCSKGNVDAIASGKEISLKSIDEKLVLNTNFPKKLHEVVKDSVAAKLVATNASQVPPESAAAGDQFLKEIICNASFLGTPVIENEVFSSDLFDKPSHTEGKLIADSEEGINKTDRVEVENLLNKNLLKTSLDGTPLLLALKSLEKKYAGKFEENYSVPCLPCPSLSSSAIGKQLKDSLEIPQAHPSLCSPKTKIELDIYDPSEDLSDVKLRDALVKPPLTGRLEITSVPQESFSSMRFVLNQEEQPLIHEGKDFYCTPQVTQNFVEESSQNSLTGICTQNFSTPENYDNVKIIAETTQKYPHTTNKLTANVTGTHSHPFHSFLPVSVNETNSCAFNSNTPNSSTRFGVVYDDDKPKEVPKIGISLATALLLPPPPPPPSPPAYPILRSIKDGCFSADDNQCAIVCDETTGEETQKSNVKNPPSKLTSLLTEYFRSWEDHDSESAGTSCSKALGSSDSNAWEDGIQITYSHIEKFGSGFTSSYQDDEESLYYSGKPIAQQLIDKVQDIPLVGLQYILEVQKESDLSLNGCSYICSLCSKKMSSATLLAHIKSVPHRLKFTECHSEEIHSKFGKMEVKQWTAALVKEFTLSLQQVEKEIGRKKLAVVSESEMNSAVAYLKNKVASTLINRISISKKDASNNKIEEIIPVALPNIQQLKENTNTADTVGSLTSRMPPQTNSLLSKRSSDVSKENTLPLQGSNQSKENTCKENKLPKENLTKEKLSKGDIQPYYRSGVQRQPQGHFSERQPFGQSSEGQPFGQSKDTEPQGESKDRQPFGQFKNVQPHGLSRDNQPFEQSKDVEPHGQSRDIQPFGQTKNLEQRSQTKDRQPYGQFKNEQPRNQSRDRQTFGQSKDVEQRDNSRDRQPFEQFKDKQPHGQSRDRQPFGQSTDWHPSGQVKDRMPFDHTRDVELRGITRYGQPFDQSKDEPPRSLSRDRQSRDLLIRGLSRDRQLRGRSRDLPLRGLSKDRQSRGRSRDLPPRGLSRDRLSRGSSRDRQSHGDSKDGQLRRLSRDKDRPSHGRSRDRERQSRGHSRDRRGHSRDYEKEKKKDLGLRDRRRYSPLKPSSGSTTYRKRSRSRSPPRGPGYRSSRSDAEKISLFEKPLKSFKADEAKLKVEHLKDLDHYMKDPESHPLYKTEWERFWDRRYREVEQAGKDAKYYNFKSEWISFWQNRFKELCELEFDKKRKELLFRYKIDDPLGKQTFPYKSGNPSDGSNYSPSKKKEVFGIVASQASDPFKSNIPVDFNLTSFKKGAAFEGSMSQLIRNDPFNIAGESAFRHGNENIYQRKERVASPWERGVTHTFGQHYSAERPNQKDVYEAEFSIVGTLKLLTDLEDQLGSLVPATKALLKKAVEITAKGTTPIDLFRDNDNLVLLKLSNVKLCSQVTSGILDAMTAARTQKAIEATNWLMREAEKILPSIQPNADSSNMLGLNLTLLTNATRGMNTIEIAQYIARQLLNIGRSDASETDLQNILAAVSASHAIVKFKRDTLEPVQLSPKVENVQISRENHSSNYSSELRVSSNPTPALFPSGVRYSKNLNTDTSVAPNTVQGHANAHAHSPAPVPPNSTSAPVLDSTTVSKERNLSKTETIDDSQSKSGLSLLQAAYEESTKDMDKLSLEDLQKLLSNFRNLNNQEQQALTSYLKKLEATDSKKVTKLRAMMHQSNRPSTTLPNETTVAKSKFPYKSSDNNSNAGIGKNTIERRDLFPSKEAIDSSKGYHSDEIRRPLLDPQGNHFSHETSRDMSAFSSKQLPPFYPSQEIHASSYTDMPYRENIDKNMSCEPKESEDFDYRTRHNDRYDNNPGYPRGADTFNFLKSEPFKPSENYSSSSRMDHFRGSTEEFSSNDNRNYAPKTHDDSFEGDGTFSRDAPKGSVFPDNSRFPPSNYNYPDNSPAHKEWGGPNRGSFHHEPEDMTNDSRSYPSPTFSHEAKKGLLSHPSGFTSSFSDFPKYSDHSRNIQQDSKKYFGSSFISDSFKNLDTSLSQSTSLLPGSNPRNFPVNSSRAGGEHVPPFGSNASPAIVNNNPRNFPTNSLRPARELEPTFAGQSSSNVNSRNFPLSSSRTTDELESPFVNSRNFPLNTSRSEHEPPFLPSSNNTSRNFPSSSTRSAAEHEPLFNSQLSNVNSRNFPVSSSQPTGDHGSSFDRMSPSVNADNNRKFPVTPGTPSELGPPFDNSFFNPGEQPESRSGQRTLLPHPSMGRSQPIRGRFNAPSYRH